MYGVAMLGFASLYFIYASHRPGPAVGPPWFPGNPFGAYFMTIALLAAGAAIATGKMRRPAAALLSALLLLRFAFLHLPGLIMHSHDPGPWTSSFEILALCGAAMVLAYAGPFEGPRAGPTNASMGVLANVGCFLFAISLVIFGVQHFMYAKFVATLVPAWIPARLFWAYFVGAAFFATTLSLITRVMARLAATLLGIMFLIFVVTTHIPRVAAARSNGNEWTSAFVALAMAGSAFIIAGALRAKRLHE